jgi:hypothetical protein
VNFTVVVARFDIFQFQNLHVSYQLFWHRFAVIKDFHPPMPGVSTVKDEQAQIIEGF